ncbi:DUF899 family protein [Nitrosospira sp. Nsp14]|uniref:DUF899 family protein n=1 Tax=Nitrosospira sp. Nsp14 TaxID=1855333 RepID=UPI000B828E5B
MTHLHACDTALVFVSRAPVDEIEAFHKRIGWQMPWFSTIDGTVLLVVLWISSVQAFSYSYSP